MQLSADTLRRLHGATLFLVPNTKQGKAKPIASQTPMNVGQASVLVVIHHPTASRLEQLSTEERQVLQTVFSTEMEQRAILQFTDSPTLPKAWLELASKGFVIFSSEAEWMVAGAKLRFATGEMKQGKKLLAGRWSSLMAMSEATSERSQCANQMRTLFA